MIAPPSNRRRWTTLRCGAIGLLIIGAWWLSLAAGGLPLAIAKDVEGNRVAVDVGVAAPEGFEVVLYAGDDLATNIHSMTIDSQGRVVVAGPGYVKILHDDNRDGVAERASLFSESPKIGAHGMLFVGRDLIATGDSSLMRLRDSDGDGKADGEPEIWTQLDHRDHGGNGILHGPDGALYVICGNDAGVTSQHAQTPGSPVADPECGAVLRCTTEGKQFQVLAHGFRNPYDADFHPHGHLFTVDADGERDHHLPWYAPNRLFDIAQGRHHGWVLQGWTRSWSRPPEFFDSVERTAEPGRGSPTGVVVYRHTQFPPEYRGNVFSACWTFGRVYRYVLRESGSTWKTEPEVFLRTTGQAGFAPVDVVVGPEGEMYVAVGGRRTRGGVFCVRHKGSKKSPPPSDPLLAILQSPQPLAAWSRAQWKPAAGKLGAAPFRAAVADGKLSVAERIRAIEILVELFGGLPRDRDLEGAITGADPRIAARAVWGWSRDPAGLANLARLTHHPHPAVKRAAWEGMLAIPVASAKKDAPIASPLDAAAWSDLNFAADRRVWIASLLADSRHRPEAKIEIDSKRPAAEAISNCWRLVLRGKWSAEHFEQAASLYHAADRTDLKYEAVRLMQLALGDIRIEPSQPESITGYAARGGPGIVDIAAKKWGSKLAQTFPTENIPLDRELGRLLGMLAVVDGSLAERLSKMPLREAEVADELHWVFVLSRVRGERAPETTSRVASTLAAMQGKLADREQFASRNWPARVGETFSELCRHDPNLAAALIADKNFGRPDHAAFVSRMIGPVRLTAIRKLAAAAQKSDDDHRFPRVLLDLVAELPPEEALPLLREAADDFASREAAISLLVRFADPADRPLFVAGLGSIQPPLVKASAAALTKLHKSEKPPASEELLAAVKSLRNAALPGGDESVASEVASLLAKWTGAKVSPAAVSSTDPKEKRIAALYLAWLDWFAKHDPKAAAALKGFSGDLASWQKRLAAVDWSQGNAERGKEAFQKLNCYRCHQGTTPLGPDLAGAAGRFSRDDLFAAILDPSREVSPLYQASQVVTAGGKVVQGLVVYESPESTIVLTAADQTVRVAGDEIVALRKSPLSLMPVGLLNDAADRELADLYAYLKSLQGRDGK